MAEANALGDFIFGTLSNKADRVEALSQARSGLSAPEFELMDGIGGSARVLITAGPDAPVEEITLYFTNDGSDPKPGATTTYALAFTEFKPYWDTVILGYIRRFEAIIPPMLLPAGAIIRYRAIGRTRGKDLIQAANGQRFAHLMAVHPSPTWLQQGVIYHIFLDRFAITARGGIRQFDDMRVGGGGTQPNTNGRTNNFTLGGGFVGSGGSIGAVYRQMDFKYGLPHPEDEDAVRINGVRRMAALRSSINTGYAPIASLRVDGTAQWYTHGEVEPSGTVGTRFALNTQTVNITGRTQFGRANGAFGVQGLFRQYTPTGDEAFTPGASNNNVAAYVYQEVPLARDATAAHAPRVQVGVRYDQFALRTNPSNADAVVRFGAAQSRSFGNVASSVGLSVPLSEYVSVSANTSRGFRAPTVEEMYANGFHAAVGTFDMGNPNLKPEQSTGYEIGLRAQSAGTFAQINSYYNLIDRYILPRAVGARDIGGNSVPLVNYVQANAKLYGIEGQVETQLVRHVVGGVMGDFTRALFRDGTGNLPYIPAGRLGGSLRYDNGHISTGADVRRVFNQPHVSGDALDVATNAYTMLNLNATWLFTVRGSTVHSFTVRVDNVLDEQYRDATSRIKSFAFNPGRNLSAVYKLLF